MDIKSIGTIIRTIGDAFDIQDGGPGSGNWGHKGRPDHVGGSGKGGGKHNRQGSKEQGFSRKVTEDPFYHSQKSSQRGSFLGHHEKGQKLYTPAPKTAAKIDWRQKAKDLLKKYESSRSKLSPQQRLMHSSSSFDKGKMIGIMADTQKFNTKDPDCSRLDDKETKCLKYMMECLPKPDDRMLARFDGSIFGMIGAGYGVFEGKDGKRFSQQQVSSLWDLMSKAMGGPTSGKPVPQSLMKKAGAGDKIAQLKGSDRQVAYASSIRQKIVEQLKSAMPGSQKKDEMKSLIDKLNKGTSAKAIIDMFASAIKGKTKGFADIALKASETPQTNEQCQMMDVPHYIFKPYKKDYGFGEQDVNSWYDVFRNKGSQAQARYGESLAEKAANILLRDGSDQAMSMIQKLQDCDDPKMVINMFADAFGGASIGFGMYDYKGHPSADALLGIKRTQKNAKAYDYFFADDQAYSKPIHTGLTDAQNDIVKNAARGCKTAQEWLKNIPKDMLKAYAKQYAQNAYKMSTDWGYVETDNPADIFYSMKKKEYTRVGRKTNWSDIGQMDAVTKERFLSLQAKWHADVSQVVRLNDHNIEEHDKWLVNAALIQLGKNPKHTIDWALKKAEEMIDPIEKDIFTGGQFDPSTMSLRINETAIGRSYTHEKSIAKRQEHFQLNKRRAQEGRKQRPLGNVGTGIQDVMIHEYGHAVDFTYGVTDDPRFVELYESYTEQQIQMGISEYAKTNIVQFFAECFNESYYEDQREISKKAMALAEVIINDKR